MIDEAPSVGLVSAERIGGGLAADGMGELSKLLLGSQPAKALRLARDTGVLVAMIPEFAPAIGFDTKSKRQGTTLDEHIFRVVQHSPKSLPVRLAALLHDLAKPLGDVRDHAKCGAQIADAVLERLRYPTRLRRHVVALVAAHAFHLDDVGELFVRRFLREHGVELARDLVAHKDADLRSKNVPEPELAAVIRMRALLGEQASHPHACLSSPSTARTCSSVGYSEGPELGRTLERLLDLVVEDPARNDRAQLLRAGEGVAEVTHLRWDAPGPYEVVFTTRVGGVSDGDVRVAQPRAQDGRRRRPRRREPPPRVRRDRRAIPSGSRSTTRCTPRSCIGRGRARAASTATVSGRTSPTCRSSR